MFLAINFAPSISTSSLRFRPRSKAAIRLCGALAFRFGSAHQPGLIIAWSYLRDVTIGRPKLWQPWLKPQPVRLTVNAPEVEISDLYGREKKQVPVMNQSLVIPIGEEPVYLRELP